MKVIERLKSIIDKPDPLIIEIGCWNGSDTELFLNAFPECKIFGFEPDPRNTEKIKNRINSSRFELIEEAVSDKDGLITFYESHGAANGDRDWSASGSLNKPKKHLEINPHITFGNGVKVFGRKLDSFTKRKQIKLRMFKKLENLNFEIIWNLEFVIWNFPTERRACGTKS